MRDDLSSLHAFNRWADGRVLDAARKLTPEQYVQEPAPGWTSVRATLVHVAGATDIWARRLQGETPAARATEADVPTIDDVVRLFARGHDTFDRLIAALTPEQLESVWSYRNFEGKDLRLPLWAVYRHVVNHASYHRGQVASKLGRLGVTPPSTDLVVWAIEQTAKS
jgi:uncharacterized damage-inducible protein DinB